MVPRVAMLTTAGETFLIIGASVGSGVSPTAGGVAAASAAGASATSRVRRNSGLMPWKFWPTAVRRGFRSSRKQAAGEAGSAMKALPAGPDRIFRVSGSLHGDAPRLLLRALRDGDLQHPVHVACLDRLGIRALGKRETAQERARGTLDALVAVAGRLLLRADRKSTRLNSSHRCIS